MRLRLFFNIVILVLASTAVAVDLTAHEVAPSALPHTVPAMHTAGFWITRHAQPEKLILSSKEINALNKYIQTDLGLTRDVFSLTQGFKTDSLVSDFDRKVKALVLKNFYTVSGVRDSQAVLAKARLNMNVTGLVLGVAPRYGLVAHYADVRFLPTEQPLYESPGDVDFDQVQNSSLDVGEAVAVVHQSADKKWYYVYARNSEGWVQSDRVALGDAKVVKDFSQDNAVAVAVTAKADIFLNEGLTTQHDAVRMGTRVPLVRVEGDRLVVRIPTFDQESRLLIVDGYVRSNEFHQGYLPYTAQNILRQAFVMLDKPYGWGGMYGAQDCSAFINEVFHTVGIVLPRDSKDQAVVGQIIAEFMPGQKNDQRISAIAQAVPGQTLLPMKGHIMLYLGIVDGRPYAIHSVWAYRARTNGKDIIKVINKVAVTDLFLGEGSVKGSLLNRLTKILSIQ